MIFFTVGGAYFILNSILLDFWTRNGDWFHYKFKYFFLSGLFLDLHWLLELQLFLHDAMLGG